MVSCSRDAPPGASAVFRAVLYLSIYLSIYLSRFVLSPGADLRQSAGGDATSCGESAEDRRRELPAGKSRTRRSSLLYVRTVSPQTLAVLLHRAERATLPAPRYSAAMSKQPVRVVIRNRPTQESADNIMLEKDGKTVTIRQSTATVGGGAKQALQ